MVTKVLFFDTSALLKLFVCEIGTDKIKWLCNPNTKVRYSLHFVINKQVEKEFFDRVNALVKRRSISEKNGKLIEEQFRKYYKGKVFRIIGQSVISNTKSETLFQEVIDRLELKEGKNDWDGLHYQSMINALAYLGGDSRPIMVTADRLFAKKVREQGFRVINPLKQSKDEIKHIIA